MERDYAYIYLKLLIYKYIEKFLFEPDSIFLAKMEVYRISNMGRCARIWSVGKM